MSIHYVKELRSKLHLTEPPDHKPMERRRREVMLDQQTFDDIADYTQSSPTSPSPGRIYKKNLHWSGPPSNWFVYLVINAPDGNGQLHVPYTAVII